ncbi:MAG: hypothetical protein M3N42_13880 [Cyanobacteriota bacterium]|nr:hypothetical protein [Cyanobacteriota bacterium]
MECPGCKGLKIIHVRAVPGVHQQYDVECPVCDGTLRASRLRRTPKPLPCLWRACPRWGDVVRSP